MSAIKILSVTFFFGKWLDHIRVSIRTVYFNLENRYLRVFSCTQIELVNMFLMGKSHMKCVSFFPISIHSFATQARIKIVIQIYKQYHQYMRQTVFYLDFFSRLATLNGPIKIEIHETHGWINGWRTRRMLCFLVWMPSAAVNTRSTLLPLLDVLQAADELFYSSLFHSLVHCLLSCCFNNFCIFIW